MVELVLLVGRLQTENRDLSAAAAMWQERARVLTDQLALKAPETPVAAQSEPEPELHLLSHLRRSGADGGRSCSP